MTIVSEDSKELRRQLAYACRILAAHGQNDTVYGHVTYRQPGADTLWMKPAAMGLDEMTAETAIRLDLDGQVVEGDLPRHVEFPIHTEIFRTRPEVTCVIHTHPIHSIAFAAMNQPLRAVSHEGAQFTPPDVPRFTQTSDLIVTRELGEAVAETLGGSLACYLRNHGIVVAAMTIEEAVVAAINLERASQIQLLASSSGQSFSSTPAEELIEKRKKIFSPQALRNVWNYYCRGVGPLQSLSLRKGKHMSHAAMKQTALNASAATAELVAKILARFPQAQIRPRSLPMSDEDISLDVVLPMPMAEIYQVREWIYDLVIELQDRYDLLIQVSAIPEERYANINP